MRVTRSLLVLAALAMSAAPAFTEPSSPAITPAAAQPSSNDGLSDADLERMLEPLASDNAEARTTAQVVANRLARPEGERFDRVSALALGYDVREVDRFADRLTRYFRDGWPIAIDDVRGVVFSAQRGGYRESQVDLVLDAVVDVMLAVR